MGAVIDRCQVLEVQVGIDLSGLDVRMPQQLLHGADVVPGLQQVGGKGMAQRVRRGRLVDAGGLQPRMAEFSIQWLLDRVDLVFGPQAVSKGLRVVLDLADDLPVRLPDDYEFRSPHLWKRENGQWKLRHSVFNP